MIALNETNEYAAEVPFTMPLDADPLTGLTGYAWTLGEVQIKLPSGSWIDVAVAKIVEKGYGRFAARLTASQCANAGIVAIYATATDCQPYRGVETVGITGGDIEIGGIGYLMAYLPDATDPVYGTPASGAFSALTGALARVCYQNTTYVTIANGDVVEFGNGLYGIPVTTANTALRGKIYYYLETTDYQRYESYSTVLTGLLVAAEAPEAPAPVDAPFTSADPEYFDHVAHSLTRLCEYSKAKVNDV